ncbi:hypothetical protein ACQPZF_14650 [Actinosynnema sp. CS-041913]|uniref:hypothetical protein n=1 Tax=Actinosynnema sp. CS-041913 TaxID=3239917 RepID=UPI003D8CC6EE
MLTSRAWRVWLVGAILLPALLAGSGVFARARTAGQVSDVPPGRLTLAVHAGEVVLAGDVADEVERGALADAVRAATAARRVTDLVTANGHRLPVPAHTAADLVAAAVDARAADFTAVLAESTRTVRATVPDETRAAALRQALYQAGVTDHEVEVGVPELDLGALQHSVTALVRDDGGFGFEPGTASRQGHGPGPADRVGRLLRVAPMATITLNGHASTEHPDPRGLAQQRADLVRDLLAAEGVRPDRLRTAVTVDAGPESSNPSARQVDVLISAR